MDNKMYLKKIRDSKKLWAKVFYPMPLFPKLNLGDIKKCCGGFKLSPSGNKKLRDLNIDNPWLFEHCPLVEYIADSTEEIEAVKDVYIKKYGEKQYIKMLNRWKEVIELKNKYFQEEQNEK